MRILFLSNFYPPADMGGWEQWCQEVAHAFAQRGHDVWVLTSNFGLEQVKQPETKVRRLLHLESDVEHYQPFAFFRYIDEHDRHNAQVMKDTVSEIDPQIIFIWGMWQLDPRLARLAEALRPGRVAYYFCGYWPIEVDPHSSYWLAAEKKWWATLLKKPLARLAMAKQRERADEQPAFRHVAFVSRAVQQILADSSIAFGETRVIYGGIELDRFRRAAGEQSGRAEAGQVRVLYAGSLSEAKGVDTLLRATKLLAGRFEPGRFHVGLAGAGHPAFESWARAYAEEAGLQPYVSFLGRFEHAKMPALLRGFDALAFPSTWQEPLARIMMEGLAAGLALVSTTTGGTGEVLEDGKNSLTFEAGEEEALARQMERLLTEPGLMHRLGRAGVATAEMLFGFERMVDDLEAFVGELL